MFSRRKIMEAALLTGVAALTGVDTATAARDRECILHSGDSLAFLGASITEFGWNHPTGYVQLVVQCLAANGIAITPIPAGVSGNTSRDMLARLDRDVIARKPNWVTVDAGGNDVWHGSVSFDEYMTNMTALVDRAQKADIRVVLQTCTPILEDPNGAFNQKMAYYNQFQRYLAAQKHCLLADLNAAALVVFTAKTSTDNVLTTDGVHMNDRGDRLMARGLLQTLGLRDTQIAQTIPTP